MAAAADSAASAREAPHSGFEDRASRFLYCMCVYINIYIYDVYIYIERENIMYNLYAINIAIYVYLALKILRKEP